MLLIGMCTFISNDLDDIDADRINHPDRALPSGSVSPSIAAVLYFACLAAALVATRAYVAPHAAFLYYLTIALTISYRYIVKFLPSAKAPYTASTIAIPAIIVANYNRETRLYIVALAIFAFALGRELCMDVVDRAGDARSLMHRVDSNSIAICAFLLQGMSLILVVTSLTKYDPWAVLDLAAISTLLILAGICWFRLGRRSEATEVMKFQLLLGLYFLV